MMQFTHLSILGFAFAGSVLAQSTLCAANNCYRQVKASNFPARPTASDCSRFQVSTTTSVITQTTTVSPSPAGNNAGRKQRDLRAREEPPPAIPAYASSCRDPSAYASACSCIGITKSTATATSTTTLTETPMATPTSNTFILRNSRTNSYAVLIEDNAADASRQIAFINPDADTSEDPDDVPQTPTVFTIVQDSAERSRLAPATLPGTLSGVGDFNPRPGNSFSARHNFRLFPPGALENSDSFDIKESITICNVADMRLQCTAKDSAGQAPDQSVLIIRFSTLSITGVAAGETEDVIEVQFV